MFALMNKENISADKRTYSSKLREEQAEQTRERILAAVGELLRRGEIEELSFASVAKGAGVSVPTVYRYFPNRRALFEGIEAWISRELKAPPFPTDVSELADRSSEIFAYYENADAIFRTSMVAALFRDINKEGRARRDRKVASLLASVTSHLEPRQANAVHAIFRLLFGFEGYSFMNERFGVTGEEASVAVAWATRALLSQLESEGRGAKAPKTNGANATSAAKRKRTGK
jgi:AcrR family transcriptional regulator